MANCERCVRKDVCSSGRKFLSEVIDVECEDFADTSKKIKFLLNGCDICFIAEAPADITLEQLLRQCDRIIPDYCACGIKSCKWDADAEIVIDYNDIRKAIENAPCKIEKESEP